MLSWLLALVGALAAVAWLSAAIHAVLLLSHRRDDLSLLTLAVRGHLFYRQDTWKPSGHGLYRRFVRSAIAFLGCVILAIVLGVVTSSLS